MVYRSFVTNRYTNITSGSSFNALVNSGEGTKWLSTKGSAPHGDPRPDIQSPWRLRLSLPIPCHVSSI